MASQLEENREQTQNNNNNNNKERSNFEFLLSLEDSAF